jgi:N-acetylmuramoyl-L-alanine amidase
MKRTRWLTRLELSVSYLSFVEKFTNLRKGISNPLHITRLEGYIGTLVCVLAITLLSFSPSPVAAQNKIKTVVIDPGHGGRAPGTSGKYTKEKDITLKVGLKLGAIIEQNLKDVKVIYTRTKDETVELDQRAKIANENHADVFISIHANSLPTEVAEERKQSIYGTETYVMGLHVSQANFEVAKRENSEILTEENYQEKYEGFDPNSPESYILINLNQSANLESSLLLASKIESQFKIKAGRKSKGVKQAGFVVLWQTTMPSVLVEIGYLSNTKEEKELNDDKVQDYIASAIYRAFKDYKSQMELIN